MATQHADMAARFLQDTKRASWHDETLWFIRSKRDKAAQGIPEWEMLRNAASSIKNHTLNHLDQYLIEFEKNALKNGIKIHWAYDAKEHNEIIYEILKQHNIDKIVKSKSMLTEECHLNPYLIQRGVQVIDTDLGERIVQLRNEPPSHIVLPAIHLKKEDVSDTFNTFLHTEKGNNDPVYLTRAARGELRSHFIESKVALSGVNFAIANTGSIVICTNEGNADLGVHTANIHIASMGIEKLIPAANDLSVFLRLLARSATGQPITTYSSHFTRPAKGKELHVVIVNNKRTQQLAKVDYRNSLKCIRCAACFNTCPIYRKSGGYSYQSVIAGPIGSILSPNMDMKAHADLPFASTLCGSCSNVCPVKIDIHNQLWKLRQDISNEGHVAYSKSKSIQLMAFVLGKPKLYQLAGRVTRFVLRVAPVLVKNKLNPWHKQREMPAAPKQSFQEWFIAKEKNNELKR